jgi:phosphoglycolate phosphatase-like HAD superfamily hydrolase
MNVSRIDSSNSSKNRYRRRKLGISKSSARDDDDGTATTSEKKDPLKERMILIIVECDGVMIDVQTDGHRKAFNEAFKKMNIVAAEWTPAEYASLLRSGGGTAEGMIERYFHFYGYPRADLRDEIIQENQDMERAYEEYVQRQNSAGTSSTSSNKKKDTFMGGPQKGANLNPIIQPTSEDLRERRETFIREVAEMKDAVFREICQEGRLPLRKGALSFMDECLTHSNPNVRVLLVGETASSPGEGVLSACLTQMGELRSAAVSVAGSPETLAGEDNYEDALYKRIQSDEKKKKGELMAPEVGGNLQRQNFSSDVVIDSSMFSTSRRSSLTQAAIRTASEVRGFDCSFDVVFVGASNSTCKAATKAGAHSVVVRTTEQRGGEFNGADGVVDGFGSGGGLTMRSLKARMDAKRKQILFDDPLYLERC